MKATYSENNTHQGHAHRLWFLVQLIDVYFNNQMTIKVSQISKLITVNFSLININHITDLQNNFILFCQLMAALEDLDIHWKYLAFKNEALLSLPISDILTQKDDNTFQICLLYYFWMSMQCQLPAKHITCIIKKRPDPYKDLWLIANIIFSITKQYLYIEPENLRKKIISTSSLFSYGCEVKPSMFIEILRGMKKGNQFFYECEEKRREEDSNITLIYSRLCFRNDIKRCTNSGFGERKNRTINTIRDLCFKHHNTTRYL
ncbi:MAG: hypothetical protein HAW62_00505 [Endozoicomonadaceae bacterium]|nr:hypothetical protein [Endozoicomonadaceae bacterium]